MAVTGLLWDETFMKHETREGHPERPARVEAIGKAFSAAGLVDRCTKIPARPISLDSIYAVHTKEYVDRLQQACRDNAPFIDVPDSAICPESFDIARLGAGGALEAVDQVMAGTIENAFCVVRPPGHHAEKSFSMGFCLLGNVALCAGHLLNEYGLDRVLILDFDVHHGNGTQHAFETDPRVCFISIHGDPRFLYPGTGSAEERGIGEGEGTVRNIPVLPGAGDDVYHRAYEEIILPLIDDYNPEFMLLSAGFDAHRRDPLAPIDLTTECFGWMTDRVKEAAARNCEGKLVSVLEGGYDLGSLAESCALHLERLLES